MASLFHSTRNTRFLPTGDQRFLRSDVPAALTDEEVAWLRDRGITTVVDLRERREWEEKPCRLEGEPGFVYHHLPVTGGRAPRSPEDVAEVYASCLNEQTERILRTILEAPTGVLYFCNEGKDRTGVISAALLRRLGYDDGTVTADYMETRENLLDYLRAYVEAHPEVDLDILLPRPENLRILLARLG